MFVARGYGSQQLYQTIYRGATTAITSGSSAWGDITTGWGNLGTETVIVEGYKILVTGSGPYTLKGLSTFSNTGCQMRIVRNSINDVLATGPAGSFQNNYASNTDPIVADLNDGDIVWAQFLRNTTLGRNQTGASIELAPVA